MTLAEKKVLRSALDWFDWIDRNSDWLKEAIAKEYSASKADEFALKAFDARDTREGLRKMFVQGMAA